MTMNKYLTTFCELEEISTNIQNEIKKNKENECKFNIMRFVRTNEMGLSAILAFFLDPEESHGQSETYLKAFLKKIGKEDFLSCDQIVVTTEKMTKNGRRHDIFLEGKKNNKRIWIISIENKLKGALDTKDQIIDYFRDLENYHLPQENYLLIYLTKHSRIPSSYSIQQEEWNNFVLKNKAKNITIADLKNIFATKDTKQNNVDYFHQDFVSFLEESMSDRKTSPIWIKELTNNQEQMKTVLNIIDNRELIYRELFNKLINQLDNKCKKFSQLIEKGFRVQSHGNIFERYFHIGFYPEKEEECNIAVSIEFDKKYFNNCFYGIWHDYNKIEENKLNFIKEDIEEYKKYGGESDNTWIFYQYFEDGMRHWTPETWELLLSGKMADYIFNKWEPLIEILEKRL